MTETTNTVGVEFLNVIFGEMGIEVSISAGDDHEEGLVLELGGAIDPLRRQPDLISALTLLTSQVMSREAKTRQSVILDLGGAFKAREGLLATAADDLARVVVATGRRGVLDGLSSTERRIVHARLKEVDSVLTRSEGDGQNRLLIVEAAE
jgi:spoIIIJ-associated protein